MRYELVFLESAYNMLRDHFSGFPSIETFAIGFAKKSTSLSHVRLIFDEVTFPSKEEYAKRSPVIVSPTKEFMTKIYKRACSEQKHILKIHSHVGAISPKFSFVDDRNDLDSLFQYLSRTFNGLIAGSAVTNPSVTELDARICLCDNRQVHPLDIVKVLYRDRVRFIFPHSSPLRDKGVNEEVYSRNILAFGPKAQRNFSVLKIAVIGTGGLGSIVVEMLARLPVSEIILIDPDIVEISNENRLLGSTRFDTINKTPKVEMLKRHIWQVNPDVNVTAIPWDIFNIRAQSVAKSADIIIGCVDDPKARLAINKLALAHGIPYFDGGTGIKSNNGTIEYVAGQVYKVIPGTHYCLDCLGSFSSQKQPSKTDQEGGYIQGEKIPSPSVYFLNMSIASHLVWMMMRYVVGIRCPDKVFTELLNYSLDQATVQASVSNCPVCSPNGVLSIGDDLPLLASFASENAGEPYSKQKVVINGTANTGKSK